MSNLKPIAENYFKNFSNKDIKALKNMFTDDVELRDWVFNVKGIENVIDVNIKIFKNNEKILVKPLNIWQIDNLIFADLEIDTGKEKKELVLDILDFDHDKIRKIIAYRGN
tara:strand:+ start:542 stop:874 length:333 start_codon:yes stop_codon:yes gene_type:complete